jgi:hypothetical protein
MRRSHPVTRGRSGLRVALTGMADGSGRKLRRASAPGAAGCRHAWFKERPLPFWRRPAGTLGGVLKPILIVGRDNFRDNQADIRLFIFPRKSFTLFPLHRSSELAGVGSGHAVLARLRDNRGDSSEPARFSASQRQVSPDNGGAVRRPLFCAAAAAHNREPER